MGVLKNLYFVHCDFYHVFIFDLFAVMAARDRFAQIEIINKKGRFVQ